MKKQSYLTSINATHLSCQRLEEVPAVFFTYLEGPFGGYIFGVPAAVVFFANYIVNVA